jgi:ATP-binding cassette subfamily F protein 3
VAAPFVGLDQHFVGDDVQLFLYLALNVFTVRRAQHAAQKKPLQKRLAEVERELARIEARIAEIDTRLAAPDAYRDAAAAAELGRERGALQRDREAAEERWLELGAALEALDATG